MNRYSRLLTLALVLASPYAHACTPPAQERYAQTEKRVRERFASVDSVELVTLLHADVVQVVTGGIAVEMDAEHAFFRVDRVYKGKSKPGDTLVLTSFGSCAFSVVGDRRFKTVFDAATGKPVKPAKQWLIYRNAGEKTQITESDLTRPVTAAWFDLQVLKRRATARHRVRGSQDR